MKEKVILARETPDNLCHVLHRHNRKTNNYIHATLKKVFLSKQNEKNQSIYNFANIWHTLFSSIAAILSAVVVPDKENKIKLLKLDLEEAEKWQIDLDRLFLKWRGKS